MTIRILSKIGFNTRQVNELFIKSFLKEGSNPLCRPSLRDLTDNSNALFILGLSYKINGIQPYYYSIHDTKLTSTQHDYCSFHNTKPATTQPDYCSCHNTKLTRSLQEYM